MQGLWSCKFVSDDDIYLYDFCRNSERKRKERAQLVYERKKQLNKLRMKAEKAVEEKLDPHMEIIAPLHVDLVLWTSASILGKNSRLTSIYYGYQYVLGWPGDSSRIMLDK